MAFSQRRWKFSKKDEIQQQNDGARTKEKKTTPTTTREYTMIKHFSVVKIKASPPRTRHE